MEDYFDTAPYENPQPALEGAPTGGLPTVYLGPYAGFSNPNATPTQSKVLPASQSSYFSDLGNKVLDSKYIDLFISEAARSRFGRNTLPGSNQGGKTQVYTGIMNPVPTSAGMYPYSSTAQPNQGLNGVFSNMNWIIFAIIGVVLLLFVRR